MRHLRHPRRHRSSRGSLRLVAAAAAAVLGVTLLPGTASAAPDDRSARWLSQQLTDGAVVFPQYGDYVDYGLTADTAYALKAIGGQKPVLDEIRAALAEGAQGWTVQGDDVRAGSTAKAIVAAQVTKAAARDFGGVNLVKQLNSLVNREGSTTGRIQDRAATDYNNTYSQALAVRGLARAGSGLADEARGFLLKQQCSEGWFRLNFAAPDTRKQACDAGGAELSSPDTDATALAVISLEALPRKATNKAVRNAVADAVAWLKASQKKNGSFGGGTATEQSNSNSTGLAAWALGEAGACKKARRAAQWVKGLQVSGDVSGTPLAGEKGAIAYDRDAYEAAEEEGITDGTQYEWRKAGVDAAPALSFLRCS